MFGSPSQYQPQGVHWGWDIWAEPGTPIRALDDFKVILSRENDEASKFWQWIILEYTDGTCHLHAHLLKGSIPSLGETGEEGDIVGEVGTLKDALYSVPHDHSQFFRDRSVALGIPATHVLSLSPTSFRKKYGETLAVKRPRDWQDDVGRQGLSAAQVAVTDAMCQCGAGVQDVDYSAPLREVERAQGYRGFSGRPAILSAASLPPTTKEESEGE